MTRMSDPMSVPTHRRFANVDRWGPVSQLLHWAIVVLIVVLGYLGLTMTDLPNGANKIEVYGLHKSLGLTVLALVALRVFWRLWAGAPPDIASTPHWQHRIASITHGLLYVLLFAVPISGWVVNSASGFPLRWFGLVRVPPISPRDHALHELSETVHEWLFWAIIVVALAHAAAALYHHLFQHDATLARMLPNGWVRARSEESRDA
jgi:cytochrome b561